MHGYKEQRQRVIDNLNSEKQQDRWKTEGEKWKRVEVGQ